MTKNLWTKRKTNLIVLLMLLLTMSFCTTGCKGNDTVDPSTVESSQTYQGDHNVLGEGQTEFYFTVVDATGNETEFEIHTDKENVGEALQEYYLIAGDDEPEEDQPIGLMVSLQIMTKTRHTGHSISVVNMHPQV